MTTPAERLFEVGGNQNQAEPVEIWKARKIIRDQSDGELSLTKIAKSVNLSSNYLSEKFKQVTGVNLVDYIGRTRIYNACELIVRSNARISEVAFAVGFQSLSQFNRVFKKLMHQTPTEFRQGSRQSKATGKSMDPACL